MKNLILLFALLLSTMSVKADTWTVDNNSQSASQFTNIQTAIDSASAGDTIMVEGSSREYSPFTINKSLTLIGEGYISAFGPAVIIRANTNTPPIQINASNVVLKGFNVFTGGANSVLRLRHNNDTLKNVLITDCKLLTILVMGNTSGPKALFKDIIVRNSIITYGLSLGRKGGVNQYWNYRIQLDNFIIENCILEGYFELVGNSPGNVVGLETLILRQNIFKKESTTPVFRPNPQNTDPFHSIVVYNNIFYRTNPSGCDNCMFYHNSFWDPVNQRDSVPYVPTGTNQLLRTNPLFINYPGGDFRFNPTTYDFHLNTGSPCLTGGTGGTQIGIYGGAYPFNIGHVSNVPKITQLQMLHKAIPADSSSIVILKAHN